MRTGAPPSATAARAASSTSLVGAPPVFARARAATDPVTRRLLEGLDPEIRRVASFHLGYTDARGGARTEGAGKAARPALAIVSAEAVGARADVAVPGAVAVELVHNFSLLHDDVMDGDLERRHRPTAWALLGVGAAIVAGDALVTLAHQALLDPPTPERVGASVALARATGRMIAGQARDLAFESRFDVTYDECLAMCEDKTGALLACAASIGAILAGGPERTVAALHAFGMHLGAAYQAIDDLLGLWGAPEVTGKPCGNDLLRGKKTLPVVAALTSGTAAGHELARILAGGEGWPAEHRDGPEAGLREALALVEEAGGRDRAAREADHRAGMAVGALDGADVDGSARSCLLGLAAFVTGREA
jgi:geranylgeranyl diphosphate synthase type I